MFTIWVVFHVLVSVALILVVLMQSAKGEGLAGTAFSGGMSGAVFGGRGAASFLSRATTVLAVIFMVNCGALAFMSAETRRTAEAADVTESTVTRMMSEEQERAAQQRAAQQEAAVQDSIAQATMEGEQPADVFPIDTTGN